ncbi:MAG: 3-phosphoshikimate 1-carboxyvinyltransferase, partial [Ignavibacteriales bacterium]
TKNSFLKVKNVSLNETRRGFLLILEKMGAEIYYENISVSSGESYGDIIVKSSELKNIDIPGEIIPNIIDEIPILSVAGLFAKGTFKIRNASELRKKESDRINSLCTNYKQSGLSVEEYDDGFSVSGKIKTKEVIFDSFHDHRIAMAFSILAFLLKEGGKVDNFSCVNISNPDFMNQVKQIAG